MKRLQQFLGYIHSLSEEARKLLALASTVVLAVLIFSLWMGNASSRLTSISSKNPALNQQAPTPPTESKSAAALGPAAGIAESLRSLEFVVPDLDVKDRVGKIEMNDLYDSYNSTEKSAKKFLAAIYGTVYGWAEKIWMKIYAP